MEIVKKKYKFLDATTLKYIAMAAMLIDHIGSVLLPHLPWMRAVGRIAFPILAYFIAVGAKKTSSRMRYAWRLLLFAFVSEIPFDLAFHHSLFSLDGQNVFFTLAMGLMACQMADEIKRGERRMFNAAALGSMIVLAQFAKVDYGALGVVMILGFYLFGEDDLGLCLVLLGTNYLLSMSTAPVQHYALMSLPLLLLYNGARGKKIKYFFYIFYPAHLLVVWLVFYYGLLYRFFY